MDYLNVKELAELKSCSERYVQKLIKDNKIKAKVNENSINKRKEYIIYIEDLPNALKEKYLKKINKHKQVFKVEKEVKINKYDNTAKYGRVQKDEKKSYSDFNEKERKEIDFWIDVLKYWQLNRESYKNKVNADRDIIGAINLKFKNEDIDVQVSAMQLYRKWHFYINNDLEGLIDKRGGHNKGDNSIPPVIWDGFLNFYLDDRKPTFSDVYRTTRDWAIEFYPELVHIIPSEMTFRRHFKADVPVAVVKLMRDGEKALKDECLPYIERLYDDLKVNDVWVTDNHTLDIQSLNGNGNLHRLYITAFFEAKSGIIAGWNITDNPSINSTIFALRHGIIRTGTVPKIIYSDNGSEFMSYDFGGRGRRSKKKEREMDYSLTILGRLGIELKIAQVKNARAKPVERFFLDFKNHISKMIGSYTGGNITERPESLKKRIKNGEVPIDSEIREIVNDMVELENNEAYGGSERVYRGLSKMEVYNKCVKDTITIKIKEDDLDLMLMRSETIQKVKRKGVKIRISGEDIWYYSDDAWLMYGKEVYVRYNPTDLSTARIYDKDDKYIATWEVDKTLMLAFMESDIDKVADANEKLAKITKSVKAYAKDMLSGMSSETRIDMLDVKIRKMHELRGKIEIEQSNVFSIRRANESTEIEQAKTGTDGSAVIIDINRMNKNAERNRNS